VGCPVNPKLADAIKSSSVRILKPNIWWVTEMRPFTWQIEAFEKNVGDFDKQVESMRQKLQITQEQYNQWEKDLAAAQTLMSASGPLLQPGQVLNWVCRDNLSYLDLTQNRLEMHPD
jgi:hypothetical protein